MDKLNAIQGVAFDLDGTLVDSAPGLTSAVDSALYALELPQAGEARVITWIGNGADKLMERALTWARQERAAQRAASGKPSVEDDDIPQEEQASVLRALFNRYYAQFAEEGSFLFPDVADTLNALHTNGLPLALVTNKPTPFVAPLLNALGIAHYFTVVIGGDDVQNKKPHPEPLLLVASRLGITPQSLLFVGDSRNDIQAAAAAGCPSVGLTYGYNYGEAIASSSPDVIFDRFNELLPALGLLHSENQELKTHD
ncbi:phosphoglycolate phosphatase [Klebsiella sp. RIT-PI-d]|uniref:phosphoglycolate phosphatase n=1 Tax=Klebsiella sp. RIT-PI-d TaxID=1681196 RepID=UPI00067620CB|nr:phosphoglycolate phosphatase [Klebsiella sp. RIT-PI-d]KNC11023.1 phosphoglycolate phosphatase [Klebsiella sp. RIT-PI-d]